MNSKQIILVLDNMQYRVMGATSFQHKGATRVEYRIRKLSHRARRDYFVVRYENGEYSEVV